MAADFVLGSQWHKNVQCGEPLFQKCALHKFAHLSTYAVCYIKWLAVGNMCAICDKSHLMCNTMAFKTNEHAHCILSLQDGVSLVCASTGNKTTVTSLLDSGADPNFRNIVSIQCVRIWRMGRVWWWIVQIINVYTNAHADLIMYVHVHAAHWHF